MSILELCGQIQNTWLSRTISESTWGYPILGALHVLAIALFGGAIIGQHTSGLAIDVRWIRRVGLALVAITGTVLFASAAVRYYESNGFRIKMALIVLIALNSIAGSRQHHRKLHSAISLALWAAVIFAARGIAFF